MIEEFFNLLQRAVFPNTRDEDLPAEWWRFRAQCEARELAGRETFGEMFRTRDNAGEGLEEAADGANYAYFDTVRAEELDLDVDEVRQLALMAASAFFEGYRTLSMLQSRMPVPPVAQD